MLVHSDTITKKNIDCVISIWVCFVEAVYDGLDRSNKYDIGRTIYKNTLTIQSVIITLHT